jgi:streptogramin lyase
MLSLAGCGGGGSATSAPPASFDSKVGGKVMGGEQPVSGAGVTLQAVGGSGYGAGATVLGMATTGSDGSWSIGFDCPAPGTLVYVTVLGGDAGGGSNAALGLTAALGPCGEGTLPASTEVSELSTVATIYALSQFLDSTGRIVGTPSGNSQGLANAAGNVAELVDAAAAPAGVAVPTSTLNTLANLIGSCVSSAGGVAGDGSPCGRLFAAATPAGGSPPSTTLDALLLIARNPGGKVSALYSLAPANGYYQPGLSTAPGDWTVALTLSGGGLNQPTAVAIDGSGRAWVADYQSAVSEFGPNGAALSPPGGYAGGGLEESFGIAVDGAGNAWVTNQESPDGVNSRLGSITELDAGGSILSGAGGYTGGGVYFPQAVAIDAAGNAWIADYGDSAVTELAPSGKAISPAGGYVGGGVEFPASLAVDGSGDIWLADQGSGHVSQLDAAGAALSPADGYGGGGLNNPAGLCLDPSGNVWVMDYDNSTVTALQGSGGSAPGTPMSPAAGYSGGGLAQPNGCAVDGAGNVWIANFHGTSLSLLAGAGSASPGSALSPAGGLGQGLAQPYGLAIDASGNVWISNFHGDKSTNVSSGTVTVLLGAASPVRTPMVGPPQRP